MPCEDVLAVIMLDVTEPERAVSGACGNNTVELLYNEIVFAAKKISQQGGFHCSKSYIY